MFGLIIADDFVGISETPDGLQKQIDVALGYTRKCRLSANVGKCAVVVCDEDEENPVEFRWKWGEEELPVGKLLPGSRNFEGVLVGRTHSKGEWEGSSPGRQDGRDPYTDPHLDTEIKKMYLLNVIVPTLE